jgi:hypothetical protein
MGSFDGSSTAKNGQIYANTIKSQQCEGVDIKPASFNNEIHHNIFDDTGAGTTDGISLSGSANTGVIAFINLPNRAHNNIIRRYKVRNYAGCASKWSNTTGARFDHNVCRDSLSPSLAVGGDTKNGASGLEIDHNTFCGLSSYKQASNTSFDVHDNQGVPGSGAASSLCDAEEARILAERDRLAGNPNVQSLLVSPSNLGLTVLK